MSSPGSPQHLLDVLEGGSLGRLVGPTERHKGVEFGRAVGGQLEALSVLDAFDNVIVFDALEWFHAELQDLPHTHACGKNNRCHSAVKVPSTIILVNNMLNFNSVPQPLTDQTSTHPMRL